MISPLLYIDLVTCKAQKTIENTGFFEVFTADFSPFFCYN